MDDDSSRDARNHNTVYRTVGGLDGKSMLYEHTVIKVTPTKVYVDQKPKNGNVLGFYQTRKGGTHVLDRKTLEEEGRYSLEYGPTQTSFYLRRSDIEEDVETPDPEDERSSEPEFRSVPVNALEGEVVNHFEQVASSLEARYEEFSKRLLLDVALRQSLVDVQAHGKESPLVQQLDLISMTRAKGPTDSDLQPMPVDAMRTDLIKYLSKTTDALSARYEKELATQRFIEIALRQMFADLRMYQDEATTIRWLDVLLPKRGGASNG